MTETAARTVSEDLAIHELGHVIGALINGASIAQAFLSSETGAITQCIRSRANEHGAITHELCPEDMPISHVLAGPVFSLIYDMQVPMKDVLRLGILTTALVPEYLSDAAKVEVFVGTPADPDLVELVQGSFRGLALLAYWMRRTDALRPLIEGFMDQGVITVQSASVADALGESYLNIIGLGLIPSFMATEEGRRSVIEAIDDPQQFPAPDFSGQMEDVTKLRGMEPLQVLHRQMHQVDGLTAH